MPRKKKYTICPYCGNKKAKIIYNLVSGNRVGFYCPCMEKGYRDTKINPKPNEGSEEKQIIIIKNIFN